MQGLTERITSGGAHVLRLHYSADPNKLPGTPAGDVWLQEASSGYPGGVTSPRWRKEMEIDYGALSGQKLFPHWGTLKNTVVIPPFTPTGYKLYGSYDHGWRHPACFLVHGIGVDGNIVTLWEFHASNVTYTQIARIIRTENPYAGKLTWIVADPALWAEDQTTSDQTMKCTAALFREEGVYFVEGTRGGDTTVAESLLGNYWADPAHPRYRITTDCPKLIWELGEQRHRQFSAQVATNRSQPEELVDKDNDAWDALKYFFNKFPTPPSRVKAKQIPATFEWWKKTAIKATKGEPLRTYRRELVG